MADTTWSKRITFESLDELADYAVKSQNHPNIWTDDEDDWEGRGDWNPATFTETVNLAHNGWDEHLDATVELAESAVETAERNHEIDSFQAQWDVTGCEVDVARYLAGEPENMIDYPMVKTPRQGRIIILCASIAYSAAISADTIVRRGQVITAFALALARMGIGLELWTDWVTEDNRGNHRHSIRTMVKGANDTLDPSKVLFAFSHPSNLRNLHFAVQNSLPEAEQPKVGYGRGKPGHPDHDMPEGTIYLPELRAHDDIPQAHEALRELLKESGFTE